jgi:hypothetical protein
MASIPLADNLADNVGPGGTAFLIVLALIAVTIGIFFALFGSLRRLRQSVADGKFGPQPGDPTPEDDDGPANAAPPAAEPAGDTAVADPATVTPDPGGRGGAGA